MSTFHPQPEFEDYVGHLSSIDHVAAGAAPRYVSLAKEENPIEERNEPSSD